MNMKKTSFLSGAKAMLPITTGVIPFGLVMGTVAANANLTIIQTMSMNILVFAGASQLAAVELMQRNAPGFIIVLTGITINLRFLLYSAALSSTFKNENFFIKFFGAYTLTDQTYTSLIINENKLKDVQSRILFYFGSAIVMIFAWQFSVLLGFIFGNFAPKSLSLDYAVPLSFIALVVPTLKNKTYYIVALISCLASLVFRAFPMNLGLLISAFLGISAAIFLTRKKNKENKID